MILIFSYVILNCLEIVTPFTGRKESVYQKDLSEICKRRIISSVFLGSNVLETDSETLDFSRLELPYDCFVKVKAEIGSNIILVAQIESSDDLEETCDHKPNQFIVLDMLKTYGGYWEMLATDFSTPDYKERPRPIWSLHNYRTLGDLSFLENPVQDFSLVSPIATTTDLRSHEIMKNNFISEGHSSPTASPSQFPTADDEKPSPSYERKKTETIAVGTKSDKKIIYPGDNDSSSDGEDSFAEKKAKMKSSEELNDYQVNSDEYDAKDDDVEDSDTNEDYLEGDSLDEDSFEEMIKVPILRPNAKESMFNDERVRVAHTKLLPRLYETPKPHRHFAPKYKNVIIPKKPNLKSRGEYSDFVDDGRLDYLWRFRKPPMKSTKFSPLVGLREWRRKYGGQQPINKYVDYEVDNNAMRRYGSRHMVQKLTTKKASSPSSSERYFFKVDEERKRITPDIKFQSFRTRLRYFEDAFTSSVKRASQKKQNSVTHKVPHFKPKSTTKHPAKLLRTKQLNTLDNYLKSKKAKIIDDNLKYLLDLTNHSKITTVTMKKGSDNFVQEPFAKSSHVSRNKSLLNEKAKSGRKEASTIIDKSIFVTKVVIGLPRPRQTPRKISKTNIGTTKSFATVNISTQKDIKATRTIIDQGNKELTVKPIKKNIYGLDGISYTTVSEHDYFKTLVNDFRRKAKVDNLPQTESTTNINKTTISIEKINVNESRSSLPTIKSTTLKLESSLVNNFNETKISSPIAETIKIPSSRAIERTKSVTFALTNKTTMPSSEHKNRKIGLIGTILLKTTTSLTNNTKSRITKIDEHTSIKSVNNDLKISQSPVKTSLNITVQTNATQKLTSTSGDVFKTTIHSPKHAFSDKTSTDIKEMFTNTSAQTTSYNIEDNKTILTTNIPSYEPSTNTYKDIIRSSLQMTTVDLDILSSTATSAQNAEEHNTNNVIPLVEKSSISSKRTILFDKVTNVTPKITINETKSPAATQDNTLTLITSATSSTTQTIQTKTKEPFTKSTQAKMFIAARQSTTRKTSSDYSGSSKVTSYKPKSLPFFSPETWNKSTLAYKSWENLIQAAPDMVSSLNRTKHLWKTILKKDKRPKSKKRVKRRLEYIPIEDSKPHTQEIMLTTTKKQMEFTKNLDLYLADDQNEEEYGRAHFGRMESYLGPVLYNICKIEQKKTRLVALFNTSTIIFVMNDFSLERLNLIVTSATTIAQTKSQCPLNQLECQVSGVRVCIDMSSACDDIPNCGAFDIYDEDRILCGFNLIFKHSLVLTALTFVVMISIAIYSIHYWLERCVPHVSEAFFVYTDTAENVLYLDTIMRSPNATDDFPQIAYHPPEFEEGLRMRKRMIKQGLCSLLCSIICPCCKIFKTAEEPQMSLDEFDKDHSDAGSQFEKMFKYSGGELHNYGTQQDDKATQTSFTVATIERAASFHTNSKDSLINKLGDLRSSRSYHNELELIRKLKDNSEIKKKSVEEREPSISKEDSASISQRVTAEEEELRNTVYDMAIPAALSSEHEIIDHPEEEIEAVIEALLVEPTKRLRFNEHEAGPSDGQDKEKPKKSFDTKLRRTSVDLNRKKASQKFPKN